jgi:hypothetical protein
MKLRFSKWLMRYGIKQIHRMEDGLSYDDKVSGLYAYWREN